MTREHREIREEYNELGQRRDLSELKDFAKWNWFSAAEWAQLCKRTVDFIGINDGDRVFESGCGSGAFLAEIAAHRRVTIAGVDFAENLVAIAKARLVGDFHVADITNLSDIADASYDKVLSHGVFLYLDTLDAGRRAALEMLRIAKPGATLYIGIVNDPERTATYEQPPSGCFVFPRAFWRELASEHGLTIEIVDQERIFAKPTGYDAYARLRYSLLLRKP